MQFRRALVLAVSISIPLTLSAVETSNALAATNLLSSNDSEPVVDEKKPAADEDKTPRVDVRTGPSAWRGGKLIHPRGGGYYPTVTRWANLVQGVMDELDIPRKYLPGILAQIQQESAGRPNAVNNWDSNAQRGTPSKGLLQIIKPTYRYYAKAGYRNERFQTVPYTNIYASLNYVIKRYGMSKFKLWNSGYNQGY